MFDHARETAENELNERIEMAALKTSKRTQPKTTPALPNMLRNRLESRDICDAGEESDYYEEEDDDVDSAFSNSSPCDWASSVSSSRSESPSVLLPAPPPMMPSLKQVLATLKRKC